ncbi:uncharacterized protein [Haliotis asinina]|uniref:uncharacterized protein n=1 Tax=Haliotis asinina TaxID=109174 RepID=UPI0035321305
MDDYVIHQFTPTMASVEVARHFGRPRLSCGVLSKSWFQTMEPQCGHGRQQARRNVIGSVTPEDQLISSVEMTCPVRGLQEAPGISEVVMEGEGVQMATPCLQPVTDTSPCCGPHKQGYNMISTQPPGISSALCAPRVDQCASVNGGDGDLSPSHPCVRELLSLLEEFGVQSKPVPYKPRKDRHLCTGEVFCKNLFLKDRRGNFYMVICDEQNDLDLKSLRRKLKAYRNFSFGSQDEMAAIFHVSPGGLTPFALMHGSAQDVRVVMTKDLTIEKDVLLNFHPLDANLTLPVRLTHLIKFLNHFRVQLEIVDMSC